MSDKITECREIMSAGMWVSNLQLVVVLLAAALGVAVWSVQTGASVTKLCSISLSKRNLVLRH